MIHFHGGPITPTDVAIQVWTRRHAMVSFAYPQQTELAFELCQSVALDMAEAMAVACDVDGCPRTKLHGLRMMDPTVFSHVPFASVDSTNVARNTGLDTRWRGPYQPMTPQVRGLVLVDRIEGHAAANRWSGSAGIQKNLELVG